MMRLRPGKNRKSDRAGPYRFRFPIGPTSAKEKEKAAALAAAQNGCIAEILRFFERGKVLHRLSKPTYGQSKATLRRKNC